MAVQLTKTLLEVLNEALRDRIIFWLDLENIHYGRVIHVDERGSVIVDQSNLPGKLSHAIKSNPAITSISLRDAMIGIYEVSSLN